MKKILLILLFLLLPILSAAQNRGLFPIRKNKKWGYINNTGKIVIAPRFNFVLRFDEGLAPVRVDDRWGYINQYSGQNYEEMTA